jgi:hypothetical protein
MCGLLFELYSETQTVKIILISGFHRALLYLITFIVRLMHSIMQNLEVKIYVV